LLGDGVINEWLAGPAEQLVELVLREVAGEHVVVVRRQRHQRQQLTGMNVHHGRRGVLRGGGVLFEDVRDLLLQVVVDGEHDVGSVNGLPLGERL